VLGGVEAVGRAAPRLEAARGHVLARGQVRDRNVRAHLAEAVDELRGAPAPDLVRVDVDGEVPAAALPLREALLVPGRAPCGVRERLHDQEHVGARARRGGRKLKVLRRVIKADRRQRRCRHRERRCQQRPRPRRAFSQALHASSA